ncbi:hypothetical protein [Paraburkholderia mimosarum]|uniref:hypothetical protein n=1 Tax=Paraburkholderia mimosarum TaxID=312026 RepID=UPI0004299728|nr:hypothetical protein [Paraburkholderia mimosarum]
MSRQTAGAELRNAAAQACGICKMLGASSLQRQIAYATLENIALVITTRRFSTAC